MEKKQTRSLNGKAFLCLAALLVLQGCDSVYSFLDKEGAEEKQLVGEFVPQEANLTIEEIQSLLKIYGYDPGRIDGKWGIKTRNAVERFQKDVGINETRKVDKETWHKLNHYQEIGLIDNGELNIAIIQEILSVAEVYSGKLDGKFGPRSKKAIKAFQNKNGLKADGKIGYKTLTKLSRYIVVEQ
jgi:peptidoglycan hydrolase-like protein with peptidoglycan-binding domain